MKMAHTGTHGRSGGKKIRSQNWRGFRSPWAEKKPWNMFLVFVPGQFVYGLSPNHPTKRCLYITIEWTTMYGFVIWSIYSLNIIHDVSCSSSITGFNNILCSIQPYNPPQSTQLTTNWQLFFSTTLRQLWNHFEPEELAFGPSSKKRGMNEPVFRRVRLSISKPPVTRDPIGCPNRLSDGEFSSCSGPAWKEGPKVCLEW